MNYTGVPLNNIAAALLQAWQVWPPSSRLKTSPGDEKGSTIPWPGAQDRRASIPCESKRHVTWLSAGKSPGLFKRPKVGARGLEEYMGGFG